MITIAICDDEIRTTTIIENLIYQSDVSDTFEIDVYFSGEELIRGMRERNEKYDLIFLDVEMGEVNGIDTAYEIRKRDKYCLIIFVTNYIQFAPTAFEVNAFRFLSKPIDKEKFDKYYRAARNEIVKSTDYFQYTFKRENFKILVDDIMYFESMQRQTYIVAASTNETDKRCYMKLNQVEEYLQEHYIYFYRISQSLLVNPKYVYAYKYNNMVLKNGIELQVANNRRDKVTELFCKIKCGEIIDGVTDTF